MVLEARKRHLGQRSEFPLMGVKRQSRLALMVFGPGQLQTFVGSTKRRPNISRVLHTRWSVVIRTGT